MSDNFQPDIKPWQRKKPELAFKARVFEVLKERLSIPNKDYEDDFFYINSVDWVNVVAITAANEVVMVEQYRVGIDQITLELPGGMLDAKEEDLAKAAKRELLEETGYANVKLENLGSVHANPAMLNNRSHTFLARGVERIQNQQLDSSEQIKIHLIPIDEIPKLIKQGQISHSLAICSFHLYFQHTESL